jgi:hypothetical protein
LDEQAGTLPQGDTYNMQAPFLIPISGCPANPPARKFVSPTLYSV